MMFVLMLLAFDAPSTNYLAKQLTHLLVKPTEWSLESSNQLKQLVSQCFKPERSVQANNVFLPYGSTRVTCRNTLLNNSDDRHFISQTCFHYQYHCVSLCIQPVTYAKWKKPLKCKFWHILSAYYTTLTNSKNFKNDIILQIFIPPKLNIYTINSE